MRGRGRGIRSAARTTLVLVAVAVGAALTACGGGGPSGTLEGAVTLGPIEPVEQVGASPNWRPYAATIDIATLDGDVVTTVESGDDGRFSVALEAGAYRLLPRAPEGQPFPTAAPVDVTVAAGETVRVTVAYDTGIRLPD